MPIVTVHSRPHGRAERERLVARLTAAVVDAYQVDPEAVQVFLLEADDDHWARGGRRGGTAPS